MKTFPLILSCLLFSCLWALNNAAAELFIISGNPKAPPITWQEDNKLMGVGPDLARSILTDLNLDFNIKAEGDWQQVQKKCKTGTVDMIVADYKNKTRAEYMDFSLPYLTQPIMIVVEQGKEFVFERWQSLIGKKGVSSQGKSYGEDFDKFIKEKLDVRFVSFEQAIQLLNRGEADYLIVDLYTALVYTRLLQGEDAITILDPPANTQTFHITVAKTSPLAAYLPAINKKLHCLITDGTVEKIFYIHFEDWKARICKRSRFYIADAPIRDLKYQEHRKAQDIYEKERLGSLLFNTRQGLPAAVE